MKILNNYPARKLTTIRVGGTARIVYFPANHEELVELLLQFHSENREFFLIGGGSNILFRDEMIEVPLIVNRTEGEIRLENNEITIDSGVSISDFLDFCTNNGISGFEFLAGIYGTFGGAVSGNAGAYGDCIGNHLISAQVFNGTRSSLNAAPDFFDFSYRNSRVRGGAKIILKATVSARKRDEPQAIRDRIDLILKTRTGKLPPDCENSAGSFFKNLIQPGKERRIPAAMYIDKAGCKGLRIGDAVVSEHHANFIINRGQASFSDVMELVRSVKERVCQEFGIELEEEVIYYPA